MRIAVFSDFHCHSIDATPRDTLFFTDALASPIKNNPLSSLKELIRENSLKADLVVSPGDFSNRMDKHGLKFGWQSLKDIGAMFGTKDVFGTAGNHDVDAFHNPGLAAFDYAKGFALDFPTDVESEKTQFWSKGFFIRESSEYILLIINTVLLHDSRESAKRGKVTQNLLESVRQELSQVDKASEIPKVCLLHHHPILHEDLNLGIGDTTENGSLLIEILEKEKFTICVHGHKHHPKISYSSLKLPILAAGSFSATLKDLLATRIRNVFHIIDVSESQNSYGRFLGTIKTWQFNMNVGWNISNTEATEFPHECGFGYDKSLDSLAQDVFDVYTEIGDENIPVHLLNSKIDGLPHILPGELWELERLLAEKYHLCFDVSYPQTPRTLAKVRQ